MTQSVPDGEDVTVFFSELPAAPEAWVNAVGVLEGVELSVVQAGAVEASERVPGRVSLVSLSGPRTGPLFATLSRFEGGGTRLFGGRLVKGRSAGVSFVLIGSGAPVVEVPGGPPPAGAAAAGAPREEAARARPVAVTPAGAPGWAELARQSPPDDEEETDEVPKYGDRVLHFVFGLCDVMVVRGDRLKIRDVHGPGRLREIALSAVRVLPPEEHEGKRVFKLVKRG